MAGPHQIWKMPLDEREIGPYAGNGREDIVDGPLLPRVPYMLGFSSFAQPSGLSSDGTWLYVADSEGSSIRAVPFDAQEARADGRWLRQPGRRPPVRVRRQGRPAGGGQAAALPGGRVCRPRRQRQDLCRRHLQPQDQGRRCQDAARPRRSPATASPARATTRRSFTSRRAWPTPTGKLYVADTNNHLIRVIDLATNKVSTLTIAGLQASGAAGSPQPIAGGGGAEGEAAPQPAPRLLRRRSRPSRALTRRSSRPRPCSRLMDSSS